mgnify:CR=1 FL=1
MRVPPPGAGPPVGGNCTRTAPCHAPVCPPKAAWRRRNALTRPHFSAKDSRKPTKAKTVNGALRAVKARQRLLPVRPIPYAAGGSNGTRPSPACAWKPATHKRQRQGGGRRGTHLRRSAKTLGWRSQCGRRRCRPRRERRRFRDSTQIAPASSGPAPVSLWQSPGAERSKAPGRMMRPGASAVSSSAPVSFRQGRSAQPGRRRF